MNDNNFLVRTHDVHLDNEYAEWLCDVKRRYKNTQIKASVKVNSEQLLFNWQLGRDLVALRAEEKWGKGVVEQVSLDLQDAFPGVKGFGVTNLWYMKRWYLYYSGNPKTPVLSSRLTEQLDNEEKLHQVGEEIDESKLHQVGEELPFPPAFAYVPWRHHIEIIVRCKSVDEAFFYIQRTIENGWSRKALLDNLEADLYHKVGGAVTNYQDILPVPHGKLAQELTKENYDLGFISLPEGYDEEKLETAIEQRMTRFLLELGNGWAFVGRQKEVVVAGKSRKIDLLFFHIHLRFYLVVELKVRPFEPEFAGKLNFYVNVVDELIKTDNENPTVGLLICKSMDRTEVQWALQGITTPIGVATYSNIKVEEVQAQLPTTEQIRELIDQAEKDYLEDSKTHNSQ